MTRSSLLGRGVSAELRDSIDDLESAGLRLMPPAVLLFGLGAVAALPGRRRKVICGAAASAEW